ncbi:zinc ion-binding protein [Prunus dulcis]|uniref:Zinc ion-binding protein n=1 Tax=Prunus dulcis TaxID=3755 RepID=A0A4Y1RJI6_PRUDU|nr:zinc ion-binding protein [Prunus dulcis]
MIQNLLMSRWIVRQHSELRDTSNGKEFPGQHPSYQDPLGLTFGLNTIRGTEIYNRDDVHEMLENSASGVHMFNCILPVYFKMLDAFLAEEKTPNEYSGQTQLVH